MSNLLAQPLPAVDFMPHDAPMALVDEIIECNADYVVTRVTITEKTMFCRAGHVPAWVGIEYMAQSAAAWSGYLANVDSEQKNVQQPVGFLLGSREYSAFCDGFVVGDVLNVRAQCLLQSAEGLGSFDCVIERNNQVVAQARLSVFQPRPNKENP